MLRELNLYPLWVRREIPADVPAQQNILMQPDVPVQSNMPVLADVAVQIDLPEHSDMLVQPAVPVDIPSAMPVQSVMQSEQEIAEQQAGDETEPLSLFDLPSAAEPDVIGHGEFQVNDSLREFQQENKGGMLGSVDWPELQQKVAGCELCKLRAGCTYTVLGVGNEHADWMFIGEAPGVDEDATGKPFAGLSGHLLDNMLLAIRLKRSEVYIANVIKCRPPEDRHPHVGEIAACLPYLKRQIDLVKPKLIVALGRTAAAALLQKDATIASMRGTLHDYQGIPLIVTFHPAYLLRSPMEKAKVWQDLCLAVKTMDELST